MQSTLIRRSPSSTLLTVYKVSQEHEIYQPTWKLPQPQQSRTSMRGTTLTSTLSLSPSCKPAHKPTKKPSPPDYQCYKTGRPACCSKNRGKDCPTYMTMCNYPEGYYGWNYCTTAPAPDYTCYPIAVAAVIPLVAPKKEVEQ